MSMPQIPEEKYRPNLCEVVIDIFKSIALEETALAHILNAEGERCQAIVKKYESCCSELTLSELDDSVRQTEKIINTIIMKEWLLLKKLETTYEITRNMRPKGNITEDSYPDCTDVSGCGTTPCENKECGSGLCGLLRNCRR